MTHDELRGDMELEHCGEFVISNDNIGTNPKIDTLPEDSINLFDKIQVDYHINGVNGNIIRETLEYIERRRLNTAINRPDALYISLKDKFQGNRLVIPFKDESGKIVFYQTRRIFGWDDKPNYLSKPISDKTLYGIDKIYPNRDEIFLFEGPIDSFFVKNGIGVAGINTGHLKLTVTQQKQMDLLRLYKKIWVLDSQWLDKTSREKTLSLLEDGETVFIWPKRFGIKYKDFNEMCVDKELDEISPVFIKDNSTHGVSAVLKYKIMFGGI